MKVNKWVAILATGSVLAVAAPVSAQFGGLGALKKKLESAAKELEKPKPQTPPTPPQSSPSAPRGRYGSPPPASPSNQINRPQQASPPPNSPLASILGKWIPSGDYEIYENQRTITPNGIEGYEWSCELTPPISDFQKYSGTEECSSVDGGTGSTSPAVSTKIMIELVDSDTIQFYTISKDGTVREFWKRSNIEE